MNDIWSLLTQEDVERALQRLWDPAWLFWGLGVVLSVLAAGPWGWTLLRALARSLTPQGWALYVGLPLMALVLVSAQLMRLTEERWLRLLEGYDWPRALHGLRRWLLLRQQRKQEAVRRELQALGSQVQEALREGRLDLPLAERYARLDTLRYTFPQGFVLPTRLGNLLRAAEEYAEHRYGLNAVLVWPRLWLLLLQEVRETLAQAYQRLLAAVRAWAWGLTFLLTWTPLTAWQAWRFGGGWAWLAPAAALGTGWLWMRLAYRLAVARAVVFGELVRAAFDLYRMGLYDALGWPRPSPEEEKEAGKRLTAFLWRGERPSSADR